jgi:hypothetical protein
MSSAVDEIIITILVIVFILILAYSFYSIYTCTGGTFKQDDWDKDKCFVIPKKSTSPAPAPAKGPAQDPATEPKQSPDSSIIKSVYEEALEYFNNFKPEDNLQFLTGLADDEWSEIQKKSEDDKTKCTVKDASVLFREGEYTEAELKETSDAIKNLCETQLKPDNDFCDNFTLGEISGDDVVIPNSGKFKTDYESEKICYTREQGGKCFPRVYNPEGLDGTYSYDLEDGILPASVNGQTEYIDTNEICKTLLKKSDCDEKKIDYIYGSDKKICRWVTGIGAYVDPLEVYKNASNACDEGSAYLQQVGTCEMNTGLDTEMGTYGEGSGAYTGNTSLGTDVVCPGQKLNPNPNGNDDKFIYDNVTRAQCNIDSGRGNNAGVSAKCFFKPKQGTYELREGKRLEKKGEYDLAPNENSECTYNNNVPCRQKQGDFILCGRCENVTMVGDDHFAKTGRTMVRNDKEYTVSTIGNGNDKVEFAIARITYQELPQELKSKVEVDMTKINLDIIGFTVTSQYNNNNYVTFKDNKSSSDVFTVYKSEIENTIEKDDRKDGNYHIFITDNTIEKEKWKMKIVGKDDVKSDEFYVNDSYKSLFDTSWAKYYEIYAWPKSYNETRWGEGTGDNLIPAGYNIKFKASRDEFSNKIEFYKDDIKVTEIDIDKMREDNSDINCNEYHDNRKGCNSETTFHHIFKGGHESRCQWKPYVHCYGEWNSPDTVIDGEGKEVPNTCGAVVPGLIEERFNELSAQKYSYNSSGVWTKDIVAVKGSKCKPEDIGWLDFTDYSQSPSGSIATDANKEDRKLPQNYTHGVPYGWWKNARPKHGDVKYTACNVDCKEETSMKNCEDHSKDNPTEEDRMKLYSGNDDDLDNYDFEKAYYASQKECKGNETKYNVIKKYAQGKGGKKCDNFTFAESHGNFDDFANDYVKHIKGDTCVIPKMMCAAGSSCIVNTTKIDELVGRINKKPNVRSEVVEVDNNNNQTLPKDESMSITIDGVKYNHDNKITNEILFRLAKKECDRFGDMNGFPNKSFCTEDKDIRYYPDNPGLAPCDFKSSGCDSEEHAGFRVEYRQIYNNSTSGTRIEQYKNVPMYMRPYEFCKWIDMPDASG